MLGRTLTCTRGVGQDSDLYLRRRDLLREEKLLSEVRGLRAEADQLNANIVSLQSELVGCRLAAKYMDKELAGRWVTKQSAGLC